MSTPESSHTPEQATDVYNALAQRLGGAVLKGEARRLTSNFLAPSQVPSAIMHRLMEMMGVASPEEHWDFAAQAELNVDESTRQPATEGRLGSITFRVFYEPGQEDDGPFRSLDYEVYGTNEALRLRATTSRNQQEEELRRILRENPSKAKLDKVASFVEHTKELVIFEDMMGLSNVTPGEAVQLAAFIGEFPANPTPGQ